MRSPVCNVAYEMECRVNDQEADVLRPAQPPDRETIRHWRNHPQVRAASFHAGEIGPAEHARWFSAVTSDPSRRLLVYEFDGVASGVVTFENIRATSASWGFYLDVAGLAERGDTLSAWLGVQAEALDHAFGPLGLEVLTAEVLTDNTAVRRANRRFGFVEGPPGERRVGGRTVRYLPISLRRDARRRATTTKERA